MLQTTTLTASQRGCLVAALLPELLAAGVTSLYLLYNDEVTDAARPSAEARQGVEAAFQPRWCTCTAL